MTGILLVAVGLVGIVFGVLPGEFYAAFIRHPTPKERRMPTWLGRIIFLTVGIWFIFSGISHLSRH